MAETTAKETPYRIVIWGGGFEYSTVANAVFDLVAKGQGEVIGIMADSLPAEGTVDGFPILPKSALPTLDYDILLCCIQSVKNDVVSEICKEYSVPREKLMRSVVMHQAHFDFGRYMRLRTGGLSIISNNCWGGYMYRRLDLRCLSPFRNLYLDDEDFLPLLADLRGHCAMEPVFDRFEKDELGVTHPVMRLGDDVRIHFNHVKTPEEAAAQWYARVDRINWDNLFVMMQTMDRGSELAFNALDAYPKRICFVPYETDQPHSLRIIQRPQDRYFFDAVNSTAITRGGSYPFDALKLLAGEPDFVRYFPNAASGSDNLSDPVRLTGSDNLSDGEDPLCPR